MESDLLIQDSLLYIVIALVGYGVVTIESSFLYGIIALTVAAVLSVIRALSKKLSIEKNINKALERSKTK